MGASHSFYTGESWRGEGGVAVMSKHTQRDVVFDIKVKEQGRLTERFSKLP